MLNLFLMWNLWYRSYRNHYIPKPVVPQVQTVTPVATSWLSQVNAYRASNGLSSVVEDSHSCAFAQKRANDLTTDYSHSGFTLDNILTYYPSYHLAFENIAYGYQDNTIIQAWISSPAHAANMRSNVQYICTAKASKGSTNYYAMEGYRP